MTPWLNTPTGGANQITALQRAVPQITTDRLTLRLPRISDWPVLEPIFTTDRAIHIGGPMSAKDAWLDFNQLVAGWVLRGHGTFTICRTADDAVLGLVLLRHEFGDPEPELGWLLTAEAEGHGYATEAASALAAQGHEIYGTGGFVSYIAEDNGRSARIAGKLGARQVPEGHPLDPTCRIYRHLSQRATS